MTGRDYILSKEKYKKLPVIELTGTFTGNCFYKKTKNGYILYKCNGYLQPVYVKTANITKYHKCYKMDRKQYRHMREILKTYEYKFGDDKVVVTDNEVRDFYPKEYNLTDQSIEQFAACYVAKCKYYLKCDPLFTPDFARRLLGEKHEHVSFTIKLTFLWHVSIRKEQKVAKYSLDACCLNNIQSFNRRYDTMEGALLHCLNGFNENANVYNRYQSLKEFIKIPRI